MKKYIAKSILVTTALLINTVTFAQGDFGDPADTDPLDGPVAPIGDYIWVLGVIGLIYVFYKMKTKIPTVK